MSRPSPSNPSAASFALVLLLLAGALAGCVESRSPQPRDGRAGLQLTGSLGGRQIAVSDGNPNFVVDDCDPNDGRDDDICAMARDLNGELLVLVFENPEALESGASLPISSDCGSPAACDQVRDAAVVRVQVGTGRRVTATGGQVRITVLESGRRRLAGEIRAEFGGGGSRGVSTGGGSGGGSGGVSAGGTLTGTFDLVPRPD